MFFSVGSGTGPDTEAPVRVAVSTISFAAVSIAEWSYALRRMRILFWVAVAIRLGALRVLACGEGGAGGPESGPAPCEVVSASLSGGGPRVAGRRPALLLDLGDDARPDRAATLADGEAQARIHGDRLDQLDVHLDVVAGHHHLHALGELGDAGHVGRAEVELRAVAREERRVAAALLLLEDVHLGLELRVRRDRPGLAEDLPALDLLALGAAQEAADVVAGLPLVEDLAEHLDPGDHGLG